MTEAKRYIYVPIPENSQPSMIDGRIDEVGGATVCYLRHDLRTPADLNHLGESMVRGLNEPPEEVMI